MHAFVKRQVEQASLLIVLSMKIEFRLAYAAVYRTATIDDDEMKCVISSLVRIIYDKVSST
jgi:hypothetical protein